MGKGLSVITQCHILMDISFFLNVDRRNVIAVWTTALTDR